MQVPLNKKEELENMLGTREKISSTADRTDTSIDQQQKVVIMDQPMRVEEICHKNNEEQNEMLEKEDEITLLFCNYVYERRKKKMQASNWVSRVYSRREVGKGNRHVQAYHLFTELTSRHEVHLEGRRREKQVSLPTVSRGVAGSSKSSSPLKPKKRAYGRKSQTLIGSSSRSVPRKRNKKSGIKEIEEGELNSRRWSYFPGKNEKSPSIFDHASKQFDLVDSHIGYKESLLRFAQNLGPTAQLIASRKIAQATMHAFQAPVPHPSRVGRLSNDPKGKNVIMDRGSTERHSISKKIAQTTTHAFQAPVPHPSSVGRLSNDPKGKNVITDKGNERHPVSTGNERPTGLFDREGTLSAGRACITSFPDASNIQRLVDVAQRSVREHVHSPTHNHSPLVLQQQQHRTPSNDIVANAYNVPAGNQVPNAYKAQPIQNSYAWTTIRPTRFNTMCHASGSSYGVWGGNQSTPVNELHHNVDPATLSQGFQHTSHNPQMQLQNQLGLEARQQQQMRLEQQPLPRLSNMFNAGTSHAGNFSAVSNHPTASTSAQNGQPLALAQKSYPNLELQLRTKPRSP